MSITEDNYNYCPTKFVDQGGPNVSVLGEDKEKIMHSVGIRAWLS